MPTNPNARLVVIPWEYNGKNHAFTMALGTAKALGIDLTDGTLGVVSVPVGGKSITRQLYPGGPTVSYDRAAGNRDITVGPQKGGAKTNKKFRLVQGSTQDTIYFSGSQARALAWLLANSNVGSSSTAIYSATGKALRIVESATASA